MPAHRTAASIAPPIQIASAQCPVQMRSRGVSAAKTAAAQATEIPRRHETTTSDGRPAIARGRIPPTVAMAVTAATWATSGGSPSEGPRSIAYPSAALVAIGARLRMRSTRNCTISPIVIRAPKVSAYAHSVTP